MLQIVKGCWTQWVRSSDDLSWHHQPCDAALLAARSQRTLCCDRHTWDHRGDKKGRVRVTEILQPIRITQISCFLRRETWKAQNADSCAWSWWKFKTFLSLLQFLSLQVPSPIGSQPKRTLPICHMYLIQSSSSLTYTLFWSHLSWTCKIDFGLWQNNVSKCLRKKWPHPLNLGWINLEKERKAWFPMKPSSMLLTETSWEWILWFNSVCEDCVLKALLLWRGTLNKMLWYSS